MKHQFFLITPGADWEHGLPVGNGRLGAMVSGQVENETIFLNEETMWFGKKRERTNPDGCNYIKEIRELLLNGRIEEAHFLGRMAMTSSPKYSNPYQPAGDVKLNFSGHHGSAGDYKRLLDMDRGIARVTYRMDGIPYEREVFASRRYGVLAIRLACGGGEGLTVQASLNRRPFEEQVEALSKDTVLMRGQCGDGVRYCCGMTLWAPEEKQLQIGDYLAVRQAGEAVLYIAICTDFEGPGERERCLERLREAQEAGYDTIRKTHEQEFGALFGRVNLQISDIDENRYSVDQLLAGAREPYIRNYLIQLLFHYGRYLLISSSYDCLLPANLQGIWNGNFTPPWESKYTTNINLQMNYWPAEACNLSECHKPLFKQLQRMLEPGRKTARTLYGCSGFVAHHNTNLWGDTDIEGIFDDAYLWPMGGVWLSLHLQEHYLYTRDTEFLKKEALPFFEESIRFFYEYLYRREDGLWLSGPSVSPENSYRLKNGQKGSFTMGCTMDNQLLRQLMKAYIADCEVCGVSGEALEMAKEILDHLPETRISSDGRILEWLEEWEETELGHRHISHLYGLYPGNEITPEKPELWEAARKTLETRLENGGGHTGWSRAWIICFYSALKDGSKAYEHLGELLCHSIQDNLLDTHPPFQIDGNFGACAGIANMLFQSGEGWAELLPAVPDSMDKGIVSGICLKGGITADAVWEKEKIKARLIAKEKQSLCIRYRGNVISTVLEAGVPCTVIFDGAGFYIKR